MMFGLVRKSKHEELQIAYLALARKYNEMSEIAIYWKSQAKLFHAQIQPATKQFTQDELRTLIQLCHPDKHQGKESAVAITQKLLRLRG